MVFASKVLALLGCGLGKADLSLLRGLRAVKEQMDNKVCMHQDASYVCFYNRQSELNG